MTTILITAAGAPGTAGTAQAILDGDKKLHGTRSTTMWEPTMRLIGVDADPNRLAINADLFDKTYVISKATAAGYIEMLQEICKNEQIDLIIPQSESELMTLAVHADKLPKQLNQDKLALKILQDKFAFAVAAAKFGLAVPRTIPVKSYAEYIEHRREFGRVWVLKERYGSGGRGMYIVSPLVNAGGKNNLYLPEQAVAAYLTRPMLMQEHIDGTEYTADCLRMPDGTVRVFERRRVVTRDGISVLSEFSPVPTTVGPQLAKFMQALDLRGLVGFQYIVRGGVPYLIECNPRVQGGTGMTCAAGANVIYAAAMYALGKTDYQLGTIEYGQYARKWIMQRVGAEAEKQPSEAKPDETGTKA